MKKAFLLGLCVWLLAVGKAVADNTLSVADVTVPKGGQATMEITYSIEDAYEGYQLQLEMAEGSKVRPVMLGGKPVMSIGYTTHSLSCSKPSENLYNAVCVSLQEGDDKILASNGTLMSVLLEADADATGTYHATLKGIKFAKTGNVEVNLANVEITITVTDALSLVTLNETSTVAPTASNTAVDVIVNRTINANEWSTICLPFGMSETQVKLAFGSDVELADFTSWDFEGTAPYVDKITIGFTSAKEIVGNHPCIIKVSNKITSFEVKNVVVDPGNLNDEDPETAVPISKGTKSNKKYYTGSMYGVYAAKNNTDVYDLFIANNQFWYSNGSTKIKAFRATFWFTENGQEQSIVLNNLNLSSSRISMSFNDSDNSGETTGIKDVKVVRSDKVYNLSGQQVEKPLKGLYIQDGKKVIIK